MKTRRDKYEHHLLLKMAGDGIAEAQNWLSRFFKTAEGISSPVHLRREQSVPAPFCRCGAAIRYQAVHSEEVEDILALDIALRRNDTEWFEHLPPEIDSKLVHKLYYGHFMCCVFHEDYIVKRGRRARVERGDASPFCANEAHNILRNTTLGIFTKP